MSSGLLQCDGDFDRELYSLLLMYNSPVQRQSLSKQIRGDNTLSKCVSTGVHSKNVPLCMVFTAFYINMREGMPEYGVKLECS